MLWIDEIRRSSEMLVISGMNFILNRLLTCDFLFLGILSNPIQLSSTDLGCNPKLLGQDKLTQQSLA